MRNGQNDQKSVNCVKGSFSIKLTKTCKENQEWNVLYIRGYDVTYAALRTLELYNFMRNDQTTRKICKTLFP